MVSVWIYLWLPEDNTSPLWWVTVGWYLNPGADLSTEKALGEGPWAVVGFNKVLHLSMCCLFTAEMLSAQLMFDIFPPLLQHINRSHWKLLKGMPSNGGEHIWSLQLFYNPKVSAQLLALGIQNTWVKQLLHFIKKYFGITYNTHTALKLSMDVRLLFIFIWIHSKVP